MAVKKYLLNMSDRRSAFYFTVKELARRGYERSVAKQLVREFPWTAYAKKEPIVFFSYTAREWADWVLEYHEEARRRSTKSGTNQLWLEEEPQEKGNLWSMI